MSEMSEARLDGLVRLLVVIQNLLVVAALHLSVWPSLRLVWTRLLKLGLDFPVELARLLAGHFGIGVNSGSHQSPFGTGSA